MKASIHSRGQLEGARERACDVGQRWASGGGSSGGTPHSGRPLGRGMRLGSHSASPAALRFCKRRVGPRRAPVSSFGLSAHIHARMYARARALLGERDSRSTLRGCRTSCDSCRARAPAPS